MFAQYAKYLLNVKDIFLAAVILGETAFPVGFTVPVAVFSI